MLRKHWSPLNGPSAPALTLAFSLLWPRGRILLCPRPEPGVQPPWMLRPVPAPAPLVPPTSTPSSAPLSASSASPPDAHAARGHFWTGPHHIHGTEPPGLGMGPGTTITPAPVPSPVAKAHPISLPRALQRQQGWTEVLQVSWHTGRQHLPRNACFSLSVQRL